MAKKKSAGAKYFGKPLTDDPMTHLNC